VPGFPTPIGIAAFAVVKLAGYTAAGAFLRRRFGSPGPPSLIFGIARTVLGLGVGIAFATSMGALGFLRSEALYYVLLAPVRVAEWLLALWFFYRAVEPRSGRRWKFAALGSAWSYLLDLPAVLAVFSVPGGMWIC
jgi:hypothetical protein